MKTKLFLTILCVCFSINLHSQEGRIIYTDFEPDSVITPLYVSLDHPNTYINQTPLDINYDGIHDISFYYDENSEGRHYLISAYLSSDPVPYIWKLRCYFVNLNDTISNIQFEIGDWYSGLYWNKISYVALRQDLGGGNYCYAWMRAMLWYEWVNTETSTYKIYGVNIYDMAYCTIPNYPLRVGQKSLDEAVEEQNIQNNFNIYPNPATNTVKILSFSIQLSDVEVYNSLGMLVDELEVNSEEVEVNISGYNPGIYFFRIKTEAGKVYTDKIVVK